MHSMEYLFTVFVTDGKRLTNNDCRTDMTLAELLQKRQYRWIDGTITVNDVRIASAAVNETLETLQHATLKGKPYTEHMKVRCSTLPDQPAKKPEPPATGKEADDVR